MGDVLLRRHIHDRFGGSRQGGISSAPHIDSVFLFTRDSGKAFGYNYDGPASDGSFSYTGEGQTGDQKLIRGNKQILKPGLTLRLFESVGRTTVRYLGEYVPDPAQPYRPEQAPDRGGKEVRNVLVFKLWPVGNVPVAEPTGTVVEEVPIENTQVEVFTTSPTTESTEAERRESRLVQRYREWVVAAGGDLVRHKIKPDGAAQPLFTDTFNRVTRELIEAKGSAARYYIRLALGQILDYARFICPASMAVLVPSRPADDLVALLAEHGVDCIFEQSPGEFERCGLSQSIRCRGSAERTEGG